MKPDTVGPEVEKLVAALQPGDVLMLENTRFYKGEEKERLGAGPKQMARLGDVYVNGAFGSAHPLPTHRRKASQDSCQRSPVF